MSVHNNTICQINLIWSGQLLNLLPFYLPVAGNLNKQDKEIVHCYEDYVTLHHRCLYNSWFTPIIIA